MTGKACVECSDVSQLVKDSCNHWKCDRCLNNGKCIQCNGVKSMENDISSNRSSFQNSKHTLPKHILIIKRTPVRYKCVACNVTFKSRANCWYHKFCAGDILKPYQCAECGRRFSSKSHMAYHTLEHTGIVPFKCSVCNKSFKTATKLKRHEKTHSESTTCFPCDICEKEFLNKSSLRVHERKHSNDKKYECSECGRTFFERKNLIYHITTHTGLKEWTCEICGKSYPSKWSLELHRRTHIHVWKFICTECNRSFCQQRYLNRHSAIHKKTVEFFCTLCDKVFSRKDNLQRHIINNHSESPVSVADILNKTNNALSCNGVLRNVQNSGDGYYRTESVIKSITKSLEIRNFDCNEIENLSRQVSVITKVHNIEDPNRKYFTPVLYEYNNSDSNSDNVYQTYCSENEPVENNCILHSREFAQPEGISEPILNSELHRLSVIESRSNYPRKFDSNLDFDSVNSSDSCTLLDLSVKNHRI